MARNSENIAGAISAVNNIVSTQTEALAQIKTTLERKAAGAIDISLGITSAAVGDIVKVKAVDADGKPTAWEAAELGETWEQLCDVTVGETITSYTQSFATPMKRIMVVLDTVAAEADTNYAGFDITFETSGNKSYKVSSGTIYPLAVPRKTAIRSVYNISTFYCGETPVVNIQTFVNNSMSTDKNLLLDSLTERYTGGMMLPQMLNFHQVTYATFAAGTRYRIWGVRA